MAAINDITGDAIQTRQSNENYRNNYDLIFGKKKASTKVETSGVNDAESCDKTVPEKLGDLPLGDTLSN